MRLLPAQPCAALRTDHLPEHVSLVAPAVQKSFWASGDWFRSSHLRLGPLLDLGIRVLIYAGGNDVESSWVGLERAVMDIEWAEQRRWARTERKEWVVDADVAGVVRELGQLSFVRVDGAGHFVSYRIPLSVMMLSSSRLHMTNQRQHWKC
jgi:carboxypeptidase C (cathepsin A)